MTALNEQQSLIALRGVCKDYATDAGALNVLRGVEFALESGACCAIVGPSGCGKSTLLHLMGALDTPTAGQVLFKGRDIAALDAREQAQLRNREIGFVFQLHHLLPQCTVLENVLVPALAEGKACGAVEARAEKLLACVGLADRRDYRPGQLSGGEQQRVAVVRALINKPALLLADEPTGSLNESRAEQLADLLLQLHADEGMAVTVVTHAPAIARRFGRVLRLHGGRLEPDNGA